MPKLYLVGGAVRDEILGRKSSDLDFVLDVKTFDELEDYCKTLKYKVFQSKPEFGTVRAQHPVYGGIDIAIPRQDGVYDGRRPENVSYGVGIVDDLARRDFTMNALAKDVETGEVLDPFGGIADIRNKIVRAVGSAHNRFAEDKLRILRMLRFAYTLGMVVDYKTMREAIDVFTDNGCTLSPVSGERIHMELCKMFYAKKSLHALTSFFHAYDVFFRHILSDQSFSVSKVSYGA